MLALASSVVLGAVMCLAGGAKIAMGRQWPAQAASMGVPPFVAPIVPWIELVSGALLVSQWQQRTLAVFMILLLAVFSASIVANLARGRRPICACFGSWSARPLGWRHLVRNALLIALAVIAAV